MALAFYGWGALLDDFLQTGNPVRSAVPHGALGLAVVLALGSGLNIFHLLVGSVYGLLLGVGLLGAMWSIGRQMRNRTVDWKWCAIVAIGAFLLLPLYLQSLDTDKLNGIDDFHTYLVLPMRILGTGTLAFDPFSYGATVSGGGGTAFLQAPVIGQFGVRAVRLMDQGCGLLLLLGALASLFRRYLLPVPGGVVLLAGGILLAEHALVNVSSYFSSLALLVALVQVMCRVEDHGWARPVVAALLLAGIVALKNTAVPFAALLCLLFVVRSWWVRSPGRLRNTVVAILVAGTFTFCWTAPKLMTRVELFPLTHGPGPDQANFGYMFWWLASGNAWNWIYLFVFLGGWGLALYATRKHPDKIPVLLVGTAALGGSLAMNYLTGGIAITRYTQPVMWVAFMLCVTLVVGRLRSGPGFLSATVLLGLSFVAFRLPPPTGAVIPEAGFNRVAGYLSFDGGQPLGDYAKDFVASMRHAAYDLPVDFPSPLQRDAVDRMQGVMTPGATALVHTGLPFLFDFRRNQIWVVDFAGVSPAPGMPLDSRDGSKLVAYLRTQSIRYIAYDYGTEAGFAAAVVNQRLINPRFTPWQRALNRRVLAFHGQLGLIATRFPKLYDDGQTFVLDIGLAPASPLPVAHPQ